MDKKNKEQRIIKQDHSDNALFSRIVLMGFSSWYSQSVPIGYGEDTKFRVLTFKKVSR